MTKKRTMVPPRTMKTLQQILELTGMKESEILDAIPVDHIMVRQTRIAAATLQNRKKELMAKMKEMDVLEGSVELRGVKLRVEGKELIVKEIELDKVLDEDKAAIMQNYKEAAGVVMDTLHIKDPQSGNQQMINSYLKTALPRVMKALGFKEEKGSDIIVPDTKIIT